MPTLKQAQTDPKAMSQFIADHDGLEVDGERFDAVMGSMVGTVKQDQATGSDGKSKELTQL